MHFVKERSFDLTDGKRKSRRFPYDFSTPRHTSRSVVRQAAFSSSPGI